MSIQTLPKAELHLHIEGTLEPELAFQLAERNNITLPYATVDDLRAAYRFDDLQSFLDLYYACMAVLVTEQDFDDLAWAYLERAAADNVRHVEMFFDPQPHVSRGVPIDAVLNGLLAALARAGREFGMSGGLILCFLRDLPPSDALATLESVAHRSGDLLGVGLDSAEHNFPPSLFTAVYERAAELGLHRVAHAGEEGPADYIWQALELLGVERIDHGRRALEDDRLLDHLVANRIPLTMCPLSNLRLGGVADLAEHPLRILLERGLVVTVNSDDPAYFGGYVAENYAAVQRSLALDTEQLRLLAHHSIEASFLDAAAKERLYGEIAGWAG